MGGVLRTIILVSLHILLPFVLGYLEGQKVIVFSTFHVMRSGSMMYAIWNQPPSWVNLWVFVFYCNIWDAGTAKNMKHKACWTSKVFTDSFTTCQCTLQKGHVIWCHKCSWHSCSPHIGRLVGFYPMMLDDKTCPYLFHPISLPISFVAYLAFAGVRCSDDNNVFCLRGISSALYSSPQRD